MTGSDVSRKALLRRAAGIGLATAATIVSGPCVGQRRRPGCRRFEDGLQRENGHSRRNDFRYRRELRQESRMP